MNSAAKRLSFLIVSAALLVGCSKKPIRPEPGETMMGPQGGGNGSLNPSTVQTSPETPGLVERGPGDFDANGQDRSALATDAVFFDFDRSAVRASERPKLQAAQTYLSQNPQYRLLLEGHCDWRGTPEYNLGLGDRRASEVKKYLVGLGVSADRLETLSKGSEEATKSTDESVMQHDRRVDLVVLRGDSGPAPADASAAPADASGDAPTAPPPAAGP